MTTDNTHNVFGMRMYFHQILSYVTSITSSAVVSVELHLPALCAQTGKSRVLAGGNCQPNVDQLNAYELFRGTGVFCPVERNSCKSAAVTLGNALIAFTLKFTLKIHVIPP